jgi:ribosomal protein S18 acetylase RimI-like enzyme
MPDSDLDNPFWHSLRSRHRELAQCNGGAARFPATHAPFLGIADADADVEDALTTLMSPGESLYMLGVTPRSLSADWTLASVADLAQMVCPHRVAVDDGPAIVELGGADRDAVLALTALVYPHYFRARTMELGRYFGIFRDGQLAAMAGERLGTHELQEISAVCTHPDHVGHGYARRLLGWLSNDVLARGRMPFLHVSQDNTRALRLYERNGYRLRRTIGLWSLRRA